MTTKEFNNLKQNGITNDCSWIECNSNKNNYTKAIVNIRKTTIDGDFFVVDWEYPRNIINTTKIHHRQIKTIGWRK